VSSCQSWNSWSWYYSSTIVPVPGGRFVVLTPLGEPAGLRLIDLETGTQTQEAVVPALSDEEAESQDPIFWGYGGNIRPAVRPQGDRIALLAPDGQIHQWSLPDLAPVGNPIPSTVNPINANSYMPGVASPLAWSPDGQVLAHLDPGGEVVLRRLDAVEPFATLVTPVLDEDAGWWDPMNAAIQVVFSRDGGAVAVSHQGGMALWGVPDWAPEPPADSPMTVLLEGPTQLAVGEAALFTATHMGSDHVHGHQFFLDEEPMSSASMERTLEWMPEVPGIHELWVLVDDGLSQATASLLVEVAGAP
jgi:hypothetical protein